MRTIALALCLILTSPLSEARQPSTRNPAIPFFRALEIRARKLEQKLGIPFDRIPHMRLRRPSYEFATEGRYATDTQEISISLRHTYRLSQRLKKNLDQMTAREIARDPEFQMLADHELGHALCDQLHRRLGYGPWYGSRAYLRISKAQAWGVDVLGEGIAMWFEYLLHPKAKPHSPTAKFPVNKEDGKRFSDYDIKYSGGYWMVRDILDQHGERGLVWLLRNPPVLFEETMRRDAEEYRKRALETLNKADSAKSAFLLLYYN